MKDRRGGRPSRPLARVAKSWRRSYQMPRWEYPVFGPRSGVPYWTFLDDSVPPRERDAATSDRQAVASALDRQVRLWLNLRYDGPVTGIEAHGLGTSSARR